MQRCSRRGVGAVRLRIKPHHQVLFLVIWTLFVLYPNPFKLGVSVARIFSPPVSPEGVASLTTELPDDPQEIERFVLKEFPYQYDWKTYNVPWYFPTVEEAVRAGTGDCKTRFVVLASIFEYLDVPYTRTVSLTHFWVAYEGKEETGIERTEYAWFISDDEGTRFQVPRERTRDVWDAFREAFWDYMPTVRKVLFVMGLPLALLLGWRPRRKSSRDSPG